MSGESPVEVLSRVSVTVTPVRAIRIDDDLWKAALEKTAAEGTTVSEVVRKALAEYVAQD